MTTPAKKNLAASVRQRLLKLSETRREAFDLVLVRYAIERLLYRLTRTPHAERFLLKGAMLFAVWNKDTHRPTRDVDLLGFGADDADEIADILRDVCGIEVEPDGLAFQANTIQVEAIRETARYGGLRVKLQAKLANVRIPVQIDIGFGDAVTPSPETVDFPALLEFPAPRLRAYPVYTVVAEKLEAVVSLGETNTRLKDFFDLWYLSREFEFDGPTLVKAVRATFDRRKTTITSTVPVALGADFAKSRESQWSTLTRRNNIAPILFIEALDEIRRFATPILESAGTDSAFPETKRPGGEWQ